MKIATSQERLNQLFDSDPRNDTAIAEALGVSKQTISMWRHGTRSPKKSVLVHISEVFNVSIEWLMGFDVEKSGKRPSTAIFIPDSEMFRKVTMYMTPDEHTIVMSIYDRAYKRMKESEESE